MGERLGRYRVLKHLATGGMADVLLARAEGIEGFERHVVLKRIRAEYAKDQRFIEMFLDEARLAANLHHQNVGQVHDIGEAAGEYFFAMEYLHGEDLRAMLSILTKTRGTMPLGTVAAVASSVAAGLHHAHERRGPDGQPLNIVHRDVSPSNILVGYDGSVKIVDFGIAKAAMRQVETRSGSLKGKVSYMSPEQCKMGTVDRRSDVYALGVVLYELATTTRLFKSDSDYLVMDAICTGKIPLPRVRRPDLPNELSVIIMTALATDPDRRYQTADELRSALDAFASTAGLTTSASRIGAYVQKLCGEKPEPWLAGAIEEKPAAGDAPTSTSSKLGWEASLPTVAAKGFRPTKIAMLVLPLLAIAGLLGWRLALTTESPDAAVTVASGLGSAMVATNSGPPATAANHSSTTSAGTPVSASATAATPGPATTTTTATGPATVTTTAATSTTATAANPSSTTSAGTPVTGSATAAKTGTATTASTRPATATATTTGLATTTATKPATGTTTTTATGPATAAKPAMGSTTTTAAKPASGMTTTTAAEPATTTATAAKPATGTATTNAARPATTTTTAANPATTTAANPATTAAANTATTTVAKPATTTTKPTTTKAAATATTPTTAGSTPAATAATTGDPRAATSPAPPPEPATAAPAMATLAPGVVEGLASKNRKALLACEGTETLKGELTVRFQIDADGRVIKTALHTTLGKPTVAGCILGALKSWRFPKQPTGSASGVYTISFQ